MDYKEANKKLTELMNTWKPEGETAEVLETCLQALDVAASGIEDDVYNILDFENIDPKLFKDHPELMERVKTSFEYDSSEYNESLAVCLREQAKELGIDLDSYDTEKT